MPAYSLNIEIDTATNTTRTNIKILDAAYTAWGVSVITLPNEYLVQSEVDRIVEFLASSSCPWYYKAVTPEAPLWTIRFDNLLEEMSGPNPYLTTLGLL